MSQMQIKILQATGTGTLLSMMTCAVFNNRATHVVFSTILTLFLFMALYCTYQIVKKNSVAFEDLVDTSTRRSSEEKTQKGLYHKTVAACYRLAIPAVIVGLLFVPFLLYGLFRTC